MLEGQGFWLEVRFFFLLNVVCDELKFSSLKTLKICGVYSSHHLTFSRLRNEVDDVQINEKNESVFAAVICVKKKVESNNSTVCFN